MNKAEFIDLVAHNVKEKKSSITKEETAIVVNTVLETLQERLYQEDDVNLTGFGKFGIRKKEARTARNPQTGDPVEVAAKNAVYFKPGKELKEYVQDEA